MNTLITLLHSRAGAFIQWLVGIVIGWLSSQLVAAGIEIPAESMHQLELGLSALGAFVITFAVQWYQTNQAKRLQTTLGTKPDGWIGETTLDAAQGVSDLANQQTLRAAPTPRRS